MRLLKAAPKLFLAVILCINFSCDQNSDNTILESETGTVTIQALANIGNSSSKSQFTATISTFEVNIKNIQLGIQNDAYLNTVFEGPYYLNMSNNNTLVDIATVTVPNNTYDKVKFNLHKNTDSQLALDQKSVEITGDIDGIPFVFWHNTENLVEVEFNNSLELSILGNNANALIKFDLNSLLTIVQTIGFNGTSPEKADRNGNGIIEINPNNDDGNGEIAAIFLGLIQDSIVLD
ncbi:MAG: hypothetical protein GQ540_10820 [Lutibacter sp.]|uniref:hypothetical protein n=1 Tax=Lutibacter sp. TaxID=1925666 RepID=UPI0019FC1994|nr:hypothetical protein [Lutibacter sp.]NOR29006.1 hypothetical protein [Lutibacter sp.]